MKVRIYTFREETDILFREIKERINNMEKMLHESEKLFSDNEFRLKKIRSDLEIDIQKVRNECSIKAI